MLGARLFLVRTTATWAEFKSLRHRTTALLFQLKLSRHRGTAPLHFSTTAPHFGEKNLRPSKICTNESYFSTYCILAHNFFTKGTCLLSPFSRLLSVVCCLLLLVSYLLSPVSYLLSLVFSLLSEVSCLQSLVACILSPVSGFQFLVLRVLSHISCLLSHVSSMYCYRRKKNWREKRKNLQPAENPTGLQIKIATSLSMITH